MTILKEINEIIWDEKFWLPRNHTWNDISIYNKFSLKNIIYIPLSTSIILFTIRILFERYIGVPLGKYLKVKGKPKTAYKPDPVLEVYYKDNQQLVSLPESIFLHISRETGKDIEQIKEWFNLRRNFSKPSKLKKFSECSWRFVFYLGIWCYGIKVLWDKSWFWDTRDCWKSYPEHELNNDIYWYYTIELGFYLSLLVTQFFDIRRKDFWQMFLHHVVTISLLLFSYVTNFTRIGSLVMLIHDCADSWLELAKMSTYANLEVICNTCFVIFALTWFVTRLVAFPVKILYTTTYEAPDLMGLFGAYYLFNILLYLLQIMHIIWFYMICRMAYKGLTTGKVDKDDRSESSEGDEDENKKK